MMVSKKVENCVTSFIDDPLGKGKERESAQLSEKSQSKINIQGKDTVEHKTLWT